MSIIIGLVLVIILLCGLLVREVFELIGPVGVMVLGIGLYMIFAPAPKEPTPRAVVAEGTAADYRAAQAAVAKATGKPCDLACKIMIADRARPPVVD